MPSSSGSVADGRGGSAPALSCGRTPGPACKLVRYSAGDMSSKYGIPLTGEAWTGWPLRVGHFDRSGKLESLVGATDSVLVWSGGATEVTLHARQSGATETHRFVRKSGMIDFLPRGLLLEEVCWQGQASGCISVNFDASRVAQLLGQPAALEPEMLRLAVTDAHIVDLVHRLQTQALGGQPLGSIYVESLALTLASYVYARYGGGERVVAADTDLPALPAERLIAFVDENLGSDLGLTRLAAVAGYSPDHFARLFKRAFGLSPYQYVLERRVERAKSLLRDRSHSIAEVAMLCGFASQAHFHTTFKARTGVTPGAYRKN
jgi:AraC family transcriptional regulator